MSPTPQYITNGSFKNIRIPLEAYIDITYRCNNKCRHCWLRLPENSKDKDRELTLEEIRRIADEGRHLGTQRWAISGGEPLLRPDFAEIFDYLTQKAITYSLNTNGTLITPDIAKLLRRKGSKMVALYGASAETHDYITRTPGSFEATMRGIAYLKEAKARFIVQIIPLSGNWHQYRAMLRLAESLSTDYRIGASWLYLSAYGQAEKNDEIMKQRLSARNSISVDPPNLVFEEKLRNKMASPQRLNGPIHGGQHFVDCLSTRQAFHINPYGGISICSRITEPSLRYDIRRGNLTEAWEHFIPAIPDRVSQDEEYIKNCGSCKKRRDCRWCAAYSYLEHGRYSAPIDYLCQMADETIRYKRKWINTHRRYYEIGGVSIQLDSDLTITRKTFDKKFEHFRIDHPGPDMIRMHLHFSLPEIIREKLGQKVYHKLPWVIYKNQDEWIYFGLYPGGDISNPFSVSIFNRDLNQADIYYDGAQNFLNGDNKSLSLFPTDQIHLSPVLAKRGGIYVHSAGMILEGNGLLFVGHSDAGKTTTVNLLRDMGSILCDDRMIVRRWPDGFRVHGTWSHGDVDVVSGDQAPLKAIFFLEQAEENILLPISDKREILQKLLPCLIKPLITAEWWHKVLDIVEEMVQQVPAYRMRFDKSGQIQTVIKEWLDRTRPKGVGKPFPMPMK